MLWRILLSLLCSSDLLVLEYRDGQLTVAILTKSDIQRKAGQYDRVFICVTKAVDKIAISVNVSKSAVVTLYKKGEFVIVYLIKITVK